MGNQSHQQLDSKTIPPPLLAKSNPAGVVLEGLKPSPRYISVSEMFWIRRYLREELEAKTCWWVPPVVMDWVEASETEPLSARLLTLARPLESTLIARRFVPSVPAYRLAVVGAVEPVVPAEARVTGILPLD